MCSDVLRYRSNFPDVIIREPRSRKSPIIARNSLRWTRSSKGYKSCTKSPHKRLQFHSELFHLVEYPFVHSQQSCLPGYHQTIMAESPCASHLQEKSVGFVASVVVWPNMCIVLIWQISRQGKRRARPVAPSPTPKQERKSRQERSRKITRMSPGNRLQKADNFQNVKVIRQNARN
jgi:hypothetical protein